MDEGGSEHLLTLLARTDLVTPSVVRLPLNGAALGLVEFHPGNSNLPVNVGYVTMSISISNEYLRFLL